MEKGSDKFVCGAKNYKVGDKVPLILPGATLPALPGEQPVTIKQVACAELNSGNMCSPKELGLAEGRLPA